MNTNHNDTQPNDGGMHLYDVRWLPEASDELYTIPSFRERRAILHVEEKLRALGPKLPFPHQSSVQGADNLRELRPRAGRSPWRALYRQLGEIFVVAAIGPEALKNKRDFNRACDAAARRLAQLTTT